MSDCSLVWGLRLVVLLRDFGSVTGLGDEFLLWEQIVREHPVELPDLVEQFELGWGVVAEVADEFADSGPVLLLDMSTIVLVSRP
jgi:hypothetical protein